MYYKALGKGDHYHSPVASLWVALSLKRQFAGESRGGASMALSHSSTKKRLAVSSPLGGASELPQDPMAKERRPLSLWKLINQSFESMPIPPGPHYAVQGAAVRANT